MLTQAITIGLLMLFAAMLPGPDFALVTKNTILHSRRSGIFTSLGISVASLFHMSYCILGLAIIISQSILLFNIIKYIGAAYLFYLGITLLLAKQTEHIQSDSSKTRKSPISDWSAFQQGFLCNVFNPKATLFFLALFTAVIKPDTSRFLEIAYAVEMFLIVTAWFSFLTIILSHPRVINLLDRAEKYISKLLAIFLIGFGIALAFLQR